MSCQKDLYGFTRLHIWNLEKKNENTCGFKMAIVLLLSNTLYSICKVSFHIEVGINLTDCIAVHLDTDMKTSNIIFISFLILLLPFQAESILMILP